MGEVCYESECGSVVRPLASSDESEDDEDTIAKFSRVLSTGVMGILK